MNRDHISASLCGMNSVHKQVQLLHVALRYEDSQTSTGGQIVPSLGCIDLAQSNQLIRNSYQLDVLFSLVNYTEDY
jgi:hypothetical protein